MKEANLDTTAMISSTILVAALIFAVGITILLLIHSDEWPLGTDDDLDDFDQWVTDEEREEARAKVREGR